MIQVHSNYNLSQRNTFGLDVFAAQYCAFSTIEELREIIDKKQQTDLDAPLLVLGGGSNVLFTKNFEGWIISNEIKGIEHTVDGDSIYVTAGAGENWHGFVMHCVNAGWAGIENLSLIPGNVGASPMQNIGAYGVEIKDVFHQLKAYHLETGEIHTFDGPSCEFGYRESVFKNKVKGQYVITEVTFKLSKTPNIKTSYGAIQEELENAGVSNPSIQDVSDAVIRIRQSKLPDPAVIGNAGSFFKNPVVAEQLLQKIRVDYPTMPFYPAGEGKAKLAAGWLIEQTGWKGKDLGGYGVHDRQALVLVNRGGASGKKLYDLSSSIIADVQKAFGVTLEREVNII